MNQISPFGKKTTKQEYLDAKSGRTWITPQNKEYIFNYRKDGQRYVFILTYKGVNIQVKEIDYNKSNIDDILQSIDNEIIK